MIAFSFLDARIPLRSVLACSGTFAPRMRANRASKMLYRPFSSNTRMFARDCREPVEGFCVSTSRACLGNLLVVFRQIGYNANGTQRIHFLYMHRLYSNPRMNHISASRAYKAIICFFHVGTTFVAEFHVLLTQSFCNVFLNDCFV